MTQFIRQILLHKPSNKETHCHFWLLNNSLHSHTCAANITQFRKRLQVRRDSEPHKSHNNACNNCLEPLAILYNLALLRYCCLTNSSRMVGVKLRKQEPWNRKQLWNKHKRAQKSTPVCIYW
jgi:hypothetical protein